MATPKFMVGAATSANPAAVTNAGAASEAKPAAGSKALAPAEQIAPKSAAPAAAVPAKK